MPSFSDVGDKDQHFGERPTSISGRLDPRVASLYRKRARQFLWPPSSVTSLRSFTPWNSICSPSAKEWVPCSFVHARLSGWVTLICSRPCCPFNYVCRPVAHVWSSITEEKFCFLSFFLFCLLRRRCQAAAYCLLEPFVANIVGCLLVSASYWSG